MALKFGCEGPIGEAGNLDGREPPLVGSVSAVGGAELRRSDVGKCFRGLRHAEMRNGLRPRIANEPQGVARG
jgi:hypothetical protein